VAQTHRGDAHGRRVRLAGATPRLGVGTRMTNSVWPGIFQAMNRRGFAANAIVDRNNDSQSVAVITQDTSYRRGGEVKLGNRQW